MLSGLSLPHLIVLLVIVLLIFGTKKLRTLGGDLGSTIKEFKKALNSDDEQPSNTNGTTPTIDKNDSSSNDQSKQS